MITTYLDKGCKRLNTSQDLKLTDDCSALWFCAEKGTDLSRFLGFMLSIFNSFTGFFWLAFSDGTGSPKLLDLKRSFGHWSIPKADVISKHDSLDENGNKLYSDIAQINAGNVDALTSVLNRNLFGIDSAIFFLPPSATLPSNNVAKPLTDLLVRRNAMEVIDEKLLNHGLIERFVGEIVSMEGVATVTLKDSNMSTIVVAVGNQFALNSIAKLMESNSSERDWKHIINESDFNRLLDVGISISPFS